MALNLTPVTPGTLSLNPISPPGSINSTYGQAVFGVNTYGSFGGGGLGTLTLTPVSAGTLTLAPN